MCGKSRCIWVMKRGSITLPRFVNALYAATSSTGFTTDAPIALDGYGTIGERMPMRRATEITVSIPTRSASCTATTLRDFTSASRIVRSPRKRSSELSGRYTLPPDSGIAMAVSGTIAFGGMLSSTAAAYTTGLNAEPGCRSALTARLKGESW